MDYEQAAAYWINRQTDQKAMARDELAAHIERFIADRNTCALATAKLHGFARCTPIEYNYVNSAFRLFSEGGLKFKGLAENNNVCLAIYDAYAGFGKLAGLQVSGTATIIEAFSQDYLALLDYKHIPAEHLHALPSPLHLIKVQPQSFDLLDSSLKKHGFDSHQHLDIEQKA